MEKSEKLKTARFPVSGVGSRVHLIQKGSDARQMKVEVLYFEGCPNRVPTVERVREALQSEDQPTEIREIEVRTQAEAESLAFLGSPSVRVNGVDIEPEARNLKSYGLSCRTYVHGVVRSGVPSNILIRRALDEHMHSSASTAPISRASRVLKVQPSRTTGSTALFGGGLAAILASTCCLGPLLLVTLGISGAWIGNLTRLEPYRPFFIAIALVALFFAWRSIYRPAEACASGEVCALRQTRRLYKLLFWASVALTFVALVYPYFAKYFY
jgi:mercuric ion transport protein